MGNLRNRVVIGAVGQTSVAVTATTDVAIASLTVGGRVQYADVLAGFADNGNSTYTGVNGEASIGAVAVGADWIASNLLAGAYDGGSTIIYPTANFGTFGSIDLPPAFPTDHNLVAEIASVKIGGAVLGTPLTLNNADAFAFESQLIASFSVGGTLLNLKAGAHNDNLTLGATNDVTVLEVP